MPIQRINYTSTDPEASTVGYSSAVKVGPHIYFSGISAMDDKGDIVGANDAYAQTLQCIKNVESTLVHANSTLADVIRTRLYAARPADWEGIRKAHSEYFGDTLPATIMVEVSSLLSPDRLVELEVDVFVIGET